METGLIVKSQNEVENFSSIKNLVYSWLAYNANKTPATLKTYEKVLKIFFKWADENNVAEISRDSVAAFLNSLERKSEKTGTIIAPRTRRLYRATLCVFIKWLAVNGIIKDFTELLPKVKGINDNEYHERKALTKSQAKQLLKLATDRAASGKLEHVRNAAIISILLTCGLRAIEISRLKMEHYNGATLEVTGKGSHGGTKAVKVPNQTRRLLDAYLAVRKGSNDADAPIFYNLSKRGGQERLKNKDAAGIQSQTVSGIVKRMLVDAKIINPAMASLKIDTSKGTKTIRRRVNTEYYKISCHSLRHFTASEMIRQNVNLEWIRQCLRHSNVAVTSVYIKDVDREKNNGTARVADSLFDE